MKTWKWALPWLLRALLTISLSLTWIFYMKAERAEKMLSDGWMVASETVSAQGRALSRRDYEGALENADRHAMLCIRTIHRYFSDHPAATYWLWKLGRYLEERKLSIPADIQKILNSLPVEKPEPQKMLYNVPWE